MPPSTLIAVLSLTGVQPKQTVTHQFTLIVQFPLNSVLGPGKNLAEKI